MSPLGQSLLSGYMAPLGLSPVVSARMEELAGDDDGTGGGFAAEFELVNVDAAGHGLAVAIFTVPQENIRRGPRLEACNARARQIKYRSPHRHLLGVVEFKAGFVVGAVTVRREDATLHVQKRDGVQVY